MAAEAERHAVDVPEAPQVKKPAPPAVPLLPMPGLLPEPEQPEPRLAPPRAAPRSRGGEQETERLRVLLTETLQALEELRRLIS